MKKRHSSEQIVKRLREAEAKIGGGRTVEEVCREMGVRAAAYYQWRKSYGPMKVDQVKRLKDLEKENGRLKMLVVLDEHARESLSIEVERSIKAPDVMAALEYLSAVRGAPQYLRSDKGPEFIAEAIQNWLPKSGVHTRHITTGRTVR